MQEINQFPNTEYAGFIPILLALSPMQLVLLHNSNKEYEKVLDAQSTIQLLVKKFRQHIRKDSSMGTLQDDFEPKNFPEFITWMEDHLYQTPRCSQRHGLNRCLHAAVERDDAEAFFALANKHPKTGKFFHESIIYDYMPLIVELEAVRIAGEILRGTDYRYIRSLMNSLLANPSYTIYKLSIDIGSADLLTLTLLALYFEDKDNLLVFLEYFHPKKTEGDKGGI